MCLLVGFDSPESCKEENNTKWLGGLDAIDAEAAVAGAVSAAIGPTNTYM